MIHDAKADHDEEVAKKEKDDFEFSESLRRQEADDLARWERSWQLGETRAEKCNRERLEYIDANSKLGLTNRKGLAEKRIPCPDESI